MDHPDFSKLRGEPMPESLQQQATRTGSPGPGDPVSQKYRAALEEYAPDDPVLELILAAQMLHDDCAEYGRVNNLGGYDNRAMARVRAAISHAWRLRR